MRKFSMVFIDDISLDLSRGEGDHLSALINILNWDAPQRVDVAAVRDALERSKGNPIRFGNYAVSLR